MYTLKIIINRGWYPALITALAVVGSRRCSRYGREQADRLSALCAQAGFSIVSGGAFGIDAAAHRAALRVGERTLAVLGSGLANPYPDRHRDLYDQIADGHGAVLSEFPMSIPSKRENFPRRNRVISGLAAGTLIVEAGPGSGALITARAARKQGRPVMAVPGNADSRTSAGCHELIRDGAATLVANLDHILDVLERHAGVGTQLELEFAPTGEATGAREDSSPLTRNLTDPQARIVQALDRPRSFDELCAATGLDASVIQAQMTLLQLRGLIDKTGGSYARKR